MAVHGMALEQDFEVAHLNLPLCPSPSFLLKIEMVDMHNILLHYEDQQMG